MGATSKPPGGHGDRVVEPAAELWPELIRTNAAAIEAWSFAVGGRDVRELRRDARTELLARAEAYTASLGVPANRAVVAPQFVVVTGHQPELFHPGVWAKYRAMQQVLSTTGAAGVDLVVDSDTFSAVAAPLPCTHETALRCHHELVTTARERTYAGAPLPTAGEVERFCSGASDTLDPSVAPEVRRNLERFCRVLRGAGADARDLAGFVTAVRRRYEGPDSDYLELPVTQLAGSRSYLTFVAGIVGDCHRFAIEFNAELAAYRSAHRVRSTAQPFPDLEIDGSRAELPFWIIEGGRRERTFALRLPHGVEVFSDSVTMALPAEPARMAAALSDAGVLMAPRAVALTLYARTFLADLFIHGLGGARYDRITEGVARRFWGVTLPAHALVSLTMHLPLAGEAPDPARLAELDRRLARLAHNPDEFLDDTLFDDPSDADRARAMCAEKFDLVARIEQSGADRKSLGMRIKGINASMREMLEPSVKMVRDERDVLAREIEAASVLAERTYPYFLWSPEEIAKALS